MSTIIKEQTSTQLEELLGQPYILILHNDDYNSFDHVINCLIDACGHNEFQAHQCALVVHNAGRCAVFIDSYDACESVYEYFIKCNLKTTLEKHDTKNS